MTTCLEKLFIRFNVRVFRERLSICACASVPFVFEGGVSDLIALVLVIVFDCYTPVYNLQQYVHLTLILV